MTVNDAIRWVDEKKHNVYSVEDKLRWLTEIESMVLELAGRFGGKPDTRPLTMETVLTAQTPYDQLYLRWLEGQIDFAGQEYLKFNNTMAVFNTLWAEYANFFCRTHFAGKQCFRL